MATGRTAGNSRLYWVFIGPSVLIVVGLTLYPALYGIYVSMTNMNFSYPTYRWVGLDNYLRLFNWSHLPGILFNTGVFVGAVVLLQMTIGFFVANLLNRAIYGRRFMRSIAILPWIIPAVIIGLMFQQMFSGSRLGIMNTVLQYFGYSPRTWLANPAEAMFIMILALTWRGIPFSIIIQLGGLQTISKDLYEAAAIDGASRWQMMRYITLPSLKPILLINLIMATSGTLNHIDIPLALTNGGPGRATEVLSLTLYKQGFQVLDASYASTIATIILVVNLIMTIVYLRLLRRREDA